MSKWITQDWIMFLKLNVYYMKNFGIYLQKKNTIIVKKIKLLKNSQ